MFYNHPEIIDYTVSHPEDSRCAVAISVTILGHTWANTLPRVYLDSLLSQVTSA